MSDADYMVEEVERDLIDQIIDRRKSELRHRLTLKTKTRVEKIAVKIAKIPDVDVPYYCAALENRARDVARTLSGDEGTVPNNPTAMLRAVGVAIPFKKEWDDGAERLRAEAIVLCMRYGNGDNEELVYGVIAALSKENEELADDIARGE